MMRNLWRRVRRWLQPAPCLSCGLPRRWRDSDGTEYDEVRCGHEGLSDLCCECFDEACGMLACYRYRPRP